VAHGDDFTTMFSRLGSRSVDRRSLLAGGGLAAVAALTGFRSAGATVEPEGTEEVAPTPGPNLVATPGVDLSGQSLNIYSSRHYDSDKELYDGFTAATGVPINLIEADADQLIERMESEGENSPADVFLTVDAGRLWRAQKEGILQPVASPILDEIVPANLRDPDGLWFGFSQRIRVIAYAKDRVDPASLSTYEALADEAWDDKILVRSSSNVYNQSLVGALIEADGLDATQAWAEGLVKNFARDPQGGDIDQITAVAAGEGDIAITNHYYYLRLLNSADETERQAAEKTALFIPNQGDGQRGVHANISGGAVAKYAPHPQAAVAFLEYLTTETAQDVFARGNFEIPIVPGVARDPSLDALGTFTVDPVDASVFGANNELALLLMLRAGWQ
jgi:iron(III) transport system substrate-binding protein